MANLGQWNALSAKTALLTTELNSIANGKVSAVQGTAFDNSAGPIYCFFDLNLASLSPTTGAYMAIWGWLSLDGTNYGGPRPSSGSSPSGTDPALRVTGSLDLTASGTPRLVLGPFTLAPGKYLFQVENGSGVTLPSSGNTLDIYTAKINLNG